jgi:hypothetical protein
MTVTCAYHMYTHLDNSMRITLNAQKLSYEIENNPFKKITCKSTVISFKKEEVIQLNSFDYIKKYRTQIGPNLHVKKSIT